MCNITHIQYIVYAIYRIYNIQHIAQTTYSIYNIQIQHIACLTYLYNNYAITNDIYRQKAGYNSRDDKLRQFAYAGNLNKYNTQFGGDLAKSMAAAFTGPLAEAYVGGGS